MKAEPSRADNRNDVFGPPVGAGATAKVDVVERSVDTYRHEALLYEGIDGFLASIVPFIREGVAREEPLLVVVSAEKIRRLTQELGRDADRVRFADMQQVGSNPARIIPLWEEFIDRHAGRPIRGVGEPVHELRSSLELVECLQHEALLNVAVDASTPLWLICPYDTASLGQSVLCEALRTHPVVVSGDTREASELYDEATVVESALDLPLSSAPAGASALTISDREPASWHPFIREAARSFGLCSIRTRDFLMAVQETIRGGDAASTTRLRVWEEGGKLVCEVADASALEDPLAGRRRPSGTGQCRPGLWLANQLCDLVQVRSTRATGTVVRLHLGMQPLSS